MFILRDLLTPLQQEFSQTKQGRKRAILFANTKLATIIPFTSSVTSNLLRALNTLFDLDIQSQRYYAFMASPTLPWLALKRSMWNQIPNPKTNDRLLVALDDFINPKTGQKIYGCDQVYDHAAKQNQSSYPWAQCVVSIGLLKKIKQRWACLPLDFMFYFMKKTIEEQATNAKIKGKLPQFETKMEQAATLLKGVFEHYQIPILIVTDSWFGNNGLWSRLNRGNNGHYHLLSMLRISIILYDLPPVIPIGQKRKRGAPKKYGKRLGSVTEYAVEPREKALQYSVFLYGKQREVSAYSQIVMLKTKKCPVRVVWVFRKTRYVALFTTDLTLSVEQIIEYYGARWKIESGFKELKQDIGSAKSQVRNPHSVINHLNFCMMSATLTRVYADRLDQTPERNHKVKGRDGFAFSDVRKQIAEVALHPDFQSVLPKPKQTRQNSFIKTLLRMVA